MTDSLLPCGLWPTRLLSPWGFPGKTTGVGCHFLLHGIFPTQGLNPHLLRLLLGRRILYHWVTWEALLLPYSSSIWRILCWIESNLLSMISLVSQRKKTKLAQSCLTLCDPMNYTVHGILQANSILHGIFPTQGSHPGLPHNRQILYHSLLSHQGSPVSQNNPQDHDDKDLPRIPQQKHGLMELKSRSIGPSIMPHISCRVVRPFRG